MKYIPPHSFQPLSKEEWKRLFIREISPKSYEEAGLEIAPDVWVEPYYIDTELDPQFLEEIQSAQPTHKDMLNIPLVWVNNRNEANTLALEALRGGADGIWFDLSGQDTEEVDLHKLLNNIQLANNYVYFSGVKDPLVWLEQLRVAKPYHWKGGLFYDPIGDRLLEGEWSEREVQSLCKVQKLYKEMRHFKTLSMDGSRFHALGGSIVQELAYTLCLFVSYLDVLTEQGFTPSEVLLRTQIVLSSGTSYLSELAKFRAMRVLIRRITDAYSVPYEQAYVRIHAQTSTRFHADSLIHTNLLRVTAGAWSALLGGADSLTVLPFDARMQNGSALAERMARNIGLLMKHESHLDKVADPSAGAYWIEQATARLVKAAWGVFLDVEETGGLQAYAHSGTLAASLEQSWQRTQQAYEKGGALVGVTKFKPSTPQPEDEPYTVNVKANRQYRNLADTLN